MVKTVKGRLVFSEWDKIEVEARQKQIRDNWTDEERENRRRRVNIPMSSEYQLPDEPYVLVMLVPFVRFSFGRRGRIPKEEEFRTSNHKRPRQQYCRDQYSYHLLRWIEG